MDLLHYHSIVTAQRDASPLAFFITILTILTDRAQPEASRDNEENLVICSNCESEIATLRCLQPGCPCNQANCGLCDRVFHKAVAKRSHVRVPLPASSTVLKRSLSVFLNNENVTNESIHIIKPIQDMPIEDLNADHQQQNNYPFSCSVIALLLASIRTMIDDRRIRMLDIPGAMLSPIISSFIKFYTEFIECGGMFIIPTKSFCPV